MKKSVNIIEILSDDLSEKKEMNKIGLSSFEAKKRLESYGYNTLTEKKNENPFKIFANQFKDLLVLILLASTIISLTMGEYIEAITISGIIFVNAVLGFLQELKTEKSLKALKSMSAPTTKVYRDGRLINIESSNIVLDDIISLQAGDKVPADCILINSKNLYCDESILTGESVPAEKNVQPNNMNKDEISNELNQKDIIYMGTIATRGKATAKVIATGMSTQMGNIAGILNNIEEDKTPLQKKLNELGKYIAISCLAICGLVVIAGVLRGQNILDMFISSISLAVAAIPEGLPAIVTIALALSVKRMITKKTLIRKLHAVETLGCANIICSDKTGTLTQNKMTVKNIVTLESNIYVSGEGYEKAGDFSISKQRINVLKTDNLNKILTISVLCNNSEINSPTKAFEGRNRMVNEAKGSWDTVGDPTEISLLVMAAKAGLTQKSVEIDYQKIEEFPFDSDKKYMSVIVKNKNGKKFLFIKGAYDILLNQSTYIAKNEGIESISQDIKSKISSLNNDMADKSLRVLGFAYKEIASEEDYKNHDNLIFLGLVGMIDPPRKEAKKSVKLFAKSGIKTIMITGDHKNTACAIAKQIGIYKNGDIILSGKDLDNMSDVELLSKIKDASVFARVSPHHKVKIVKILKNMGNIVAMTGDGVNDAPALKEADIGVAMGINGTDVTKEVSEVILLDDNFATLVHAVNEGRTIYSNIRKFIRYLLSCNIGEIVTMFLGIVMGLPMVLIPIQILLINLVTDGLPAIALGLEPAEKDIMEMKPRKISEGIFANGLLYTIIFRGCLIGLTTLAVFVVLYKQYSDIDVSRTGAFLCLVLSQLIHVFECKDERKNIFTVPYLNNIKLILSTVLSLTLVLFIVYFPPLQIIFKTVSLSTDQILIIIFYAIIFPVIKSVHDMIKHIIK